MTWVQGFIVGVATSVLTKIIVDFLPISPELRFKTNYFWKSICKRLRNPPIDMTLFLKSSNLSDKKLLPEQIRNNIKMNLMERGFRFTGEGDALRFEQKWGRTELNIDISFGCDTYGDDLIISSIESRLRAICEYNNFDGYILEITQASEEIANALRNIIVDIEFSKNLRCELKHIYELTGILSELKLTSLSGVIEEQYLLDLTPKGMITYGRLNQDVTSMMKKAIVMYS